MAERTTILLVLLAGDQGTAIAMDGLLHEIQDGINRWAVADPPSIYCLYNRFSTTDFFGIDQNTLRFGADGLLDTNYYPPQATRFGPQTQGNLPDKLTEFIQLLPALPASGPIRVIIGAHGSAAFGFSPIRMLRFLLLLFSILLNPFNRTLSGMTWSGKLSYLYSLAFMTPPPVGGFTARKRARTPALTLYHTRLALYALPQDRLRFLLMHACSMSTVESICELDKLTQHIASEIPLTGYLPFSRWFSTLGNAATTRDDLTKACFDSLTLCEWPNATGYLLGSHKTDVIGTLLSKLNDLGNELDLRGPRDRNVADAIRNARAQANVSTHVADLSRFCCVLQQRESTLATFAQPVIAAIKDLRLAHPLLHPDVTSPLLCRRFAGIGVFLPVPGSTNAPHTNELPPLFQTSAPDWCRFVDNWSH